jgi:peptide/nickel transport system ATP-binding protein
MAVRAAGRPGRGTVSIEVAGLTVRSATEELVRSVSFSIPEGGSTAIIGESGSGKSLTARALLGLLPRGVSAVGTIRIGDDVLDASAPDNSWKHLRGRRISLLLQDPFTSLSPVHRVHDQIAASVQSGSSRLLSGKKQRRAFVDERLDEVLLPRRVASQFPHELSGGMRQRVALASALAASPDLLIADEPTTALDASTQSEILDLIGSLRSGRQMSLLLISHDLTLVRGHADEVIVMYAGAVLESGPAVRVLGDPAHPYTSGLKHAAPSISHRADRLPEVPWVEPSLRRLPSGYGFGDRYPTPEAARAAQLPNLITIEPGWLLAGYSSIDEPAAGPSALAGVLQSLQVRRASGTGVTARRADAVASAESTTRAGSLLSVDGLGKSFGQYRALDHVTISVDAGESVGIVGESGSGKSTLARCIIGLESADTGTINFAGRALKGAIRDPRSMQIVFQDPYSALNPALTIGHTLREAIVIGGRDPGIAAELLDRVGLPEDYLRRYPRHLSGGQRQRVAIARALAPMPSLLICDESVSALDVSVQAQILNLLGDLRRDLGLSLLFISHDLAVINQISDRVYVLTEGRVVESGPTHRVLSAPEHSYTRSLLDAAGHGNLTQPSAPALPQCES